MIKQKPCKGINKAIGLGCGNVVISENRKYGLCKSCYINFLLNTDKGQEIMSKSIIKGKQNIKSERRKEIQQLKKDWKIKKKSPIQELQMEINKIIRLIDKGHLCISELTPLGVKYDAGHFFSVSGHSTLRFHLFNIYAQSVRGNQHKYGNGAGYSLGLSTTFGNNHLEYVLSLPIKHTILKLSTFEMEGKIKIARQIIKEIELEIKKRDFDRPFTTEERLILRAKYQKKLAIYE